MNMQPTRRRFVKITPFAGLALLAACSPEPGPPAAPVMPAPPATPAPAAAPTPAPTSTDRPMVKEDDPQAIALGYVEEATRADTTRFKNYVPGNNCANCMLYQAKAGDAVGGCPLFASKNVAAAGWCTSWVKKV